MARSLLEIRRAVGNRSGDMVLLTATADGTQTMLTDRNNLWLPDRSCAGRMLLFVGGANDGEKRVVTASTQATTSVEWGVALDTPVMTGDVAEMWRKRGQGYDPVADVNAAINNNIRIAADTTWVPGMETISPDFDVMTGTITIPADVKVIVAVEYEDGGGFWHPIPISGTIDGPGWALNRGNGTIAINHPYGRVADNRTVRLRVMRTPSVLTSDSDTTEVSFEWLLAQTNADLLQMAYTRQEEDRGLFNRWQAALRMADAIRPAMARRLPMDSQVL